MDLTNRNELKAVLERHGLTLAKTYGQHFLVHRPVLEKIIAAAFGAGDQTVPVVEVGPGIGTLTVALVEHANEVIAIERDLRMRSVLAETMAETSRVRLVEGDALRESYADLVGNRPYRIVSNLPYEITTPFLWKILAEEAVRPMSVTLLLQAEVVARMLEKPPRMQLLGLLVALSGTARQVCAVPRSAFFPPPRVDSAVVHIAGIRPSLSEQERRALSLARRAFAAPRKKMSSTLGHEAGSFGDLRPSVLTPAQWLSLAE